MTVAVIGKFITSYQLAVGSQVISVKITEKCSTFYVLGEVSVLFPIGLFCFFKNIGQY